MQLAPAQWTHHHSLRLFHISFFLAWLIILALIVWAVYVALFSARAQQSQQQTVGITAMVPEIDIGNTVALGGGFSSPYEAPTEAAEPQVPVGTEPIAFDYGPDVQIREITVNGRKESRPLFSSQYPQFSGITIYKNAPLFFEIHSSVTVRGSAYSDAAGRWSWTCPEPIDPGPHTLTVAVQDQTTGSRKIVGSSDFFVDLPPRPGQPPPIAPTAPGNNGTLFDVVVQIPAQFKTIPPGEDVVASVKLINFGRAGQPVDVRVEYTITDAEGNMVTQSSETVAVATQLSLLKTFSTRPTAPEGQYTIMVRVPSKDLIAAASDTFTLSGPPILALSQTAKTDFTVVMQGLVGLFLLSLLVLYFEYNRVAILSRIIRKVTEQDLAGQI